MNDDKGSRLHWPSLGVGAAVTLIVAVAAPMVVSYLQSREPRLVFVAPEAIPFQGPGKKIATYSVTISNEGARVAEEVVCVVRVPGGTVDQQVVTADSSIDHRETSAGDSLKIQIPVLNPSERVRASILV
jgi:hypothetical protein